MDMLKTFFPFAFLPKQDVTAFVIHIIIHVVVSAVVGWVFGLLSAIPLLGIVIGLAGKIVDLYILVSLVLCALDYLKVLK